MADTVNFQLGDGDEVLFTLHPLDGGGQPAALEGVPTWVSSDTTVLTVNVAPDGLSGTLVATGKLGNATVAIDAQGDLTGHGSDPLQATIVVTVVAGDASSLNPTPGTPTPRPPATPAPAPV